VSLLQRPEPLRDEVRRILREKVLAGELAPGEDINESELADRLGISRTPLREALLRLEHERLVGSRQGHGFYVWPLDPREAMELYDVAGALEALALRSMAGDVPAEKVSNLRTLNAQLEAAWGDPPELTRLSRTWHETLVKGTPSGPLRWSLELVRSRLHRYVLYASEFAVSSGTGELEDALSDHAAILDALEEGDRERAAERAEAHRARATCLLHQWIRETGDA